MKFSLSTRIFAALCAVAALVVGLPSPALGSGSISVTRVSAPQFFIDSSPGPSLPKLTSNYVGYRITNSGTSLADAWVQLENFSGGVVGLAANEDGLYHLGPLANGASKMAYLYLTASGATATTQSHDVVVYDDKPGAGGVEKSRDTFSMTVGGSVYNSQTVSETISANANKVTAVVTSVNPATLGATFYIQVDGETGTIGSSQLAAWNPATYATWNADVYELVQVELNVGGATATDSLYSTGLSASNKVYSNKYYFRAVGITPSSSQISPVGFISSGTQIKHTATGNFASLPPLTPAQNLATILIAASPTSLSGSGGTSTATVTLQNFGSTAITFDGVSITLPSGASYVPGSSNFNGTPLPDPYSSGSTLTYTDSFPVPAGTTRGLSFQVTFPGVVGTYTISALGTIGSTSIGTTTDTTSPVPATVDITVGTPVTITTSSPLPTGLTGTSYSQTLAATGGDGGPYTWTTTAGTLPPGTTLGANGVLSGTPTTPGTYTFTARAEDGSGDFTTKQFTVTVYGPVTITTASPLPTGLTGTSYSQTLAATGGDGGPYTWTTTAGTLPPGTTLGANGVLSGTPTTPGTYTFTARADDGSGQFTTKQFTVTVYGPVTITTSSPLPTGTTGTSYSQTLAATGGDGGPYTWSTTAGTLPPGTTLGSNGVLSGTPTTPGTYTFTARADDGSGQFTTKQFTVTVYGPVTITTASPLPTGLTGTSYSQTLAATGGDGGPYTWTTTAGTLPPGTTLGANGVLSGTPTTPGTYTFTAQAQDGASHLANKQFSVTIYDPVTITTAPNLPTGLTGASYSQTLAATGGDGGPYTWTTTAGTLPPGTTLGANGVLSGTPTTPGTYTFTAQAQDGASHLANKQFTVTVYGPVTITTSSPLPTGTTGTSYSQTLAATGGDGGPYTWTTTAGTLPPGTTLGANGVLSGTPTTPGTYTFTAQAQDGASHLANKQFTVTIYDPVTITTASPLPTGLTGTSYSQTLAATGGDGGPYTWTTTAGTLPPGTTLGANGVLSGTPTTPGTYTFTAQAQDGASHTANKQFTVTIYEPVTITTSSPLPTGLTGTSYSQTLAATGGDGGPYTWTTTAGTLPPGTTLGSNGVLSGTPTTPGTYTFTAQAQDGASHLANKQFSVTIYDPVTITTAPNLPTGLTGASYSQTLAATGGDGGPYTWTTTAGTLPPGTTLNADGTLTGTPTTVGTYTFTAHVVDGLGNAADKSFTVTIGPPVVITTDPLLPPAASGSQVNVDLNATGGGGGPYTWTNPNGGLPPGLSLSSTGVIRGTPTKSGTYTFTVQATDANGQTTTKVLTMTVTASSSGTTPGTLPFTGAELGATFSGGLISIVTGAIAVGAGRRRRRPRRRRGRDDR